MVNKSKQKGTFWESAIVTYLRSLKWPFADRLTLSGAADRGDVRLGDGIPVVIEAKNAKAITLGPWIKELEAEIANAKAEIGALWIKRIGKSEPKDAYVVMTGDTFIRLLERGGYFNE